MTIMQAELGFIDRTIKEATWEAYQQLRREKMVEFISKYDLLERAAIIYGKPVDQESITRHGIRELRSEKKRYGKVNHYKLEWSDD